MTVFEYFIFFYLGLLSKKSNFWIGLNDNDKEGDYKWSDLTKTDYTK